MYTTGATYNLCPTDKRCNINWQYDDPQYGTLFAREDFNHGIYRVRDGHFAKGAANGKDLGADMDQLPQIRNLRVETTDRAALFKYRVTTPIQNIPCVVEVSTKRDLAESIPDLNPAAYARPETDRNPESVVNDLELKRTIRVGKNVPLSPETVYWYRLQCGGDTAEGAFTTKAAMPGSRDVTIQAVPPVAGVASIAVEFGGGYDRSTDTISGATTTAPVTCATGSACSVSFSASGNAMSYYRVVYRDSNNNVIGRSAVDVSVEPGVEIAPAPKFASESVVNAGSYLPGSLAPCQLVSIFGSNLGPPGVAARDPSSDTIPNLIADTRVLFDRKAAPLLFVYADQINAVVPSGIAQQPITEIQVEYKGQASEPIIMAVAPARPGIFTVSNGTQGAIAHTDGSINSPANPAARGSYILVFGTSGGPTVPPCEEAAVVKEAKHLQLPIEASIGGVAAPVSYAGAAPFFATGVTQFNIYVPEAAPTGDAVPLVISVGGAQSQGNVSVAVK